MEMIKIFLEDLNHEAVTTRKMLERIPDDKFSYKPHEKSMDMKSLATHIAELPSWITMVLTTTELDFATSPYTPVPINSTTELLAYFEKSLVDGRSQLLPENEAHLMEPWTLRNGEEIYSTTPKHSVIRMALNQIVHHRAQLGVYLRLLNIPIPGSYGPSADEMKF